MVDTVSGREQRLSLYELRENAANGPNIYRSSSSIGVFIGLGSSVPSIALITTSEIDWIMYSYYSGPITPTDLYLTVTIHKDISKALFISKLTKFLCTIFLE